MQFDIWLLSRKPRLIAWSLIVFLLTSLFLGYHRFLFYPPYGMHFWRQADALSIAGYYYHHGMDFFTPGQNSLYNTNGKEVHEFPVVYYLAALLWQVTGQKEFVFRLLTLMFSFLGFYALFRIALYTLKDIIISTALSLLMFSSSVLIFYSISFLPDPVALGISLYAWWKFFQFIDTGKNRFLIIAFAFFTIAGLLGIAYLVNPVAMFLLFIFEQVLKINLYSDRKIFLKPGLLVNLLISLCSIFILWKMWALNYNYINCNYNIQPVIKPFWSMTSVQVVHVRDMMWHYWYTRYYYESTFHFILVISILGLVFMRRSSILMWLISLSLFIGSLFFFLFCFGQFSDNDFFVLFMVIFISFLLISSVLSLTERVPRIIRSWYFRLGLVMLAVLSLNYGKTNLEKRFEADKYDEYGINPDFYTLRANSGQLRIPVDAKIISFPDQTPNGSLYYLDREGWALGKDREDPGIRISNLIAHGAAYLVVSDTNLICKAGLTTFTACPCGHYLGIKAYKLDNRQLPIH